MIHISVGAFGMVHKGELLMPDGNARAVAIKAIKCKSLFVTYMCVKLYMQCL